MIKKPFLIILLSLMISTCSYAQRFLQSAGASAGVMRATLRGPGGKSGRFGMTHLHLNYFPRANFEIDDYTSVSVGVPLGLGAGFINNDFLGVKGTFLSYDIPFVIDYNMGFKATAESEDQVGFYFGLGFGYTATQTDTLGVTSFRANSSGILGRGGIRLPFYEGATGSGISVGFYHKLGMGAEKYQTTGINLFLDF